MTSPNIQNIATPQFINAGTTALPFQNVVVTDTPGSNDVAVIEVFDANGKLTDADGTFFPSPYFRKVAPGVYDSVEIGSVSGIDPGTLTHVLNTLQFNPAPNVGTQNLVSTVRLFVENATAPVNFSVGSASLVEIPQSPTAPSISGITAAQAIAPKVQPFSGVKVSDTATGAMETISLHVSDPTHGNFEQITAVPGVSLNETSPGVYALNTMVSPDTLTQVLNALVFDTNGTADTAIQLSITDPKTSLTTAAQPIILTADPTGGGGHTTDPVVTTNPPTSSGNYIIQDQTTGQTTYVAGQSYTGPVTGLTSELILPTTDQVTVTSTIPNVFIQIGAQGQPSPTIAGINVSQASGNNVLDSYANSSFLTDGSGTDQNYLDTRNLTQNAWSTVVNFRSGDNVTLWGVTQADFKLSWIGDTEGAAGATGLTGVFVPSSGNGPVAAITLTGYKLADTTDGKLAVTYASVGGTSYASIHAT